MRLGKLTKHINATFNSDDQTEGETIDKHVAELRTLVRLWNFSVST